MCVDYIDLNKACPKDFYPLVDHTILSFLDAYSGYNQIQMHPRDKEKYFKIFVEPEDRDYFYDTEGRTKFSFHWIQNPTQLAT